MGIFGKKTKQSSDAPPGANSLDAALIRWSSKGRDPTDPSIKYKAKYTASWTVEDAVKGVLIVGETSSGKTSTSGKELALRYLYSGFGGLVLTVKPNEAGMWQNWADHTGRSDDLRVISPRNGDAFNFLAEMMADDYYTANDIIKIFKVLYEIKTGNNRGATQDNFWTDQVTELFKHAIYTLQFSPFPNDLKTMAEIVDSAPITKKEWKDPEWQRSSKLYTAISHAFRDHQDPQSQRYLKSAGEYWRGIFAHINLKQRDGMMGTYRNLINPLIDDDIVDFFTGESTFNPMDSSSSNKIILLDMSPDRYGDGGQFAQAAIKYLWLSQMIRRLDYGRAIDPVFLWVDECPVYVTRHDAQFFSRTREAKVIHTYLAQSRTQFVDRIGEQPTNELLAAKPTIIFHKMTLPEDCEWAARTISQYQGFTASFNRDGKDDSKDQKGKGKKRKSFSLSQQDIYHVPPYKFPNLPTGGGQDNGVVGCIFMAPTPRFVTKALAGRTKLTRHLQEYLQQPPRES